MQLFGSAEEKDFSKPEIEQSLKSDLIIDAILGTGFKPPLEGLGCKAVEIINASESPVLSVDVPSGSHTDSFLPARAQGLMCRSDGVITFTAPKPVHVFGEVTQGPMAVASIGSPRDLLLETKQLNIEGIVLQYLNILFRPREPDSHKGDFGHVLIIGGSVGKAGAAAMAGMAALHTGAGLVTIACPQSVQPTIASFAPEIMTEALPETENGTLLYRPSIALSNFSRKKTRSFWDLAFHVMKKPMSLCISYCRKWGWEQELVLDADGLNAFATCPDKLRSEGLLILTPHPGEMARLTGEPIAEGHKRSYRVSTKSRQTTPGDRRIKRSSDGDCVSQRYRVVNMSGNPGMAKGGSGDVLSGIIAATQTQQTGMGWWISPETAKQREELIQRRDKGDIEARKELEEMQPEQFAFIVSL